MSDTHRDNPAFDAQREKLDQQAVYSASVVLLERLQEHHSYTVPDRRAEFPKPVIPEAVAVAVPVSNSEIAAAHDLLPRLDAFTKVEWIMKAVLAFYPGVTLADLKSSRRTAAVVLPRQIAMYCAKTFTTRSLPDIGRRFGGRDHTTVIHAIRKIGALVGTDLEIARQISLVEDSFLTASA